MKLSVISHSLPLYLITFVALAVTHDFSSEYISIQQTLSRYLLAIDSKNFAALASLFTDDVVANYSNPIGVLNGLQAVQTVLGASLNPVTTQHALTTQVIDIDKESNTANATTYFTGTHFGRGEYEGQIVTAWGRYEDVLIRVDRQGWRVKQRSLVYMGPLVGNLSIFADSP